MSLHTIDKMKPGVGRVTEPHVVKNKKLGFRPEERRISDSGALQVRFRFFGHAAWIAIIRLTCDWIDNRANETERRFRIKDVDPSGRRIGYHQHVGRVNYLPPPDARAVETDPIRENVFVVLGERGREMLPGSGQVGELEVHKFHVAVL